METPPFVDSFHSETMGFAWFSTPEAACRVSLLPLPETAQPHADHTCAVGVRNLPRAFFAPPDTVRLEQDLVETCPPTLRMVWIILYSMFNRITTYNEHSLHKSQHYHAVVRIFRCTGFFNQLLNVTIAELPAEKELCDTSSICSIKKTNFSCDRRRRSMD